MTHDEISALKPINSKSHLPTKTNIQSRSPNMHALFLKTIQARFSLNKRRHTDVDWSDVRARLISNPAALRSLQLMESTGGEPDVVILDGETDPITFFDCSPESPIGRRGLCYDRQALDERREAKPAGSAVDVAKDMGVELLTEEQYRQLQNHGQFDLKTSSWISTPAVIRSLGGALFCDRRYDHVFTYHNGAQSYYAARGFRAALRIRE